MLQGPGGNSLQINLANKPSLLRSRGLAQTYFTLQPCGLNQPHWHPRGSMTTHIISGAVMCSCHLTEASRLCLELCKLWVLCVGLTSFMSEGFSMGMHQVSLYSMLFWSP